MQQVMKIRKHPRSSKIIVHKFLAPNTVTCTYLSISLVKKIHLNKKRYCNYKVFYDPVYTVTDPHSHDIILDSFYKNVALKCTIILQNLMTATQKKL